MRIRTALEGIGRRPFADKMSNAALGLSGASRAGTRQPMMRDELEPYRAATAAIDPGIAIVLELQLELGLRAGRRCKASDRWPIGGARLRVRWEMAS